MDNHSIATSIFRLAIILFIIALCNVSEPIGLEAVAVMVGLVGLTMCSYLQTMLNFLRYFYIREEERRHR